MRISLMMLRFIAVLFVICMCIQLSSSANALTIIRDDEAETILSALAKPIFAVSGLDSDAVQVMIVNDDSPNAFVFGGQNIFVTTGLIKFSQDPDAIVGVLAHETGHIVGGHLVYGAQEMRNLQAQMGLSLLAGAIAGIATKSSDAAIGTLSATNASFLSSYMKFNRAQETAADNAGLKYLSKLGVGSKGIVSFLTELNTIERTFYSDINLYQRSHPLSKERIDMIEDQTRNLKSTRASYISEEMRQKFLRVYNKIVAFTDNPTDVLAKYGSQNLINAKYMIAIAQYRLGNKDLALSKLDEILAQEPNNPYFNELKGQILFDFGDVKNAIKYYEVAARLRPHSDLLKIEYSNALIYNNTNIGTAVKMLEGVIAKDPSDIQAWSILAKAYDILKRNADSQTAIAYNAYLTGDEVTARKYVNTIKQYKGLNKPQMMRLTQLQDLLSQSEQ